MQEKAIEPASGAEQWESCATEVGSTPTAIAVRQNLKQDCASECIGFRRQTICFLVHQWSTIQPSIEPICKGHSPQLHF